MSPFQNSKDDSCAGDAHDKRWVVLPKFPKAST